MNASVLLTGCAGFIGWKVTEFLLQQGTRVTGVDNLCDAYDVRLKQWRLEQLKNYDGFTFFELDIADRQAVRRLFEQTGCDWEAIINLAARAGVRASVRDPWVYYDTNVTGTLNLLEMARENGIKKFVLASTSSLYGVNNPRPFREDARTDGPLSPYAASKKAAETLCYTYHHLVGMDVTVLRYFTVYGPAGRPDMSMFRFIQWIAEDRPVVVYGDGRQSRDFTYVDDIARGTLAGLKPVGYEIINLGSDYPVVLMDMIHTIEKYLGKKAKLEYRPAHPADMPATWADITKARTLLGWSPEVSFEDGVRATVNWYLENRPWASQVNTRDEM